MIFPLARRLAAAALFLAGLSACGGGTEPEPASRLAIATQPIGAVNGSLLATQPVVVLQTASGGTATGATNTVSVSLTGPGSLDGTTTVTAVDGVATFTNLRVTGTGSFTLLFSSAGLTSATSAAFTMAPLPATHLAVALQPTTSTSGTLLTVQPNVALLDGSGAIATAATTPVTASIASGTGSLSGTLTVTPVNGIATFTNLVIAGSGAHALRFTAGSLTPAITSSFTVLGPPASLAFYSPRVLVDAGNTFPTVFAIRDASGDMLATTPSFVSRNPAVATVDSRGVLTGVSKGQAVIQAAVPGSATLADSLLAVVSAQGGTALYTSFTGFTARADSTVTILVYMDTRASGSRIASGLIDVRFNPGQLAYQSTVPDAVVAPAVNDGSASTGVVRLSFASTAGFDGVTTIARLTFRAAATPGTTGSIQVLASELTATDYSDLLPNAVQVTQPIVLR